VPFSSAYGYLHQQLINGLTWARPAVVALGYTMVYGIISSSTSRTARW
jgi:branched-subunit amino acid ABC-type transport system permease component